MPDALCADDSSVAYSPSGAYSSTTPSEAPPSVAASGFFSTTSMSPRSLDLSTPPPPSHRHAPSASNPNFTSTLDAHSPQSSVGEGLGSGEPSPFQSPSSIHRNESPATPSFPTPWHALAAMSGAPTSALEFPPSLPGARDSPKLGQPFERLNLGPPSDSSPSKTSPSRSPGFSIPAGAISGRALRPDGLRDVPSLAHRRSSVPTSPFNLNNPSAPTSSSPLAASSSTSRLQPISAADLVEIVESETTIILDLRPPSVYEASHLAKAHSMSVPSTLLRRPAFGLSKLIQMLGVSAQATVSNWKGKSNIVLVDQDSSSAPEGSVLQGVSSKFEKEGFSGNIWFVYGGQAAIEGNSSFKFEASDAGSDDTPPAVESTPVPGLGRLSRLAFQYGSTGGGNHPGVPQTAAASVRVDPFKQLSLPTPLGARKPRSTESSRVRLQPANPFFDNIRQNLELSHGGITERIPLALPNEVVRRADELPPFLRDLVKMPNDESMELLAQQFQQVERREQNRLQSVMDVLSRQSHDPDSIAAYQTHVARTADEVQQIMGDEGKTPTGYYPFSITAGVERGTKNRYKNIWPYDFSRVRLQQLADDDSDYINASFVQPRGTTRRYIATQGPLDATYRDFWTLVWEQGVHVLVMLTKQFEGGLIKCGKYWDEQRYGDLRLQLVSQTGGEDVASGATTGFDFGSHSNEFTSEENIKRVFKLSNVKYPEQGTRTVTQIQCVSWPDFDVPDSPDVLLGLMRDVDKAVEELCGCNEDRCSVPPVLVHCSAGIGRTGSYILADAITDALRREYRQGRLSQNSGSGASNKPSSVSSGASKPDGILPHVTSAPIIESPNNMDLDSPENKTLELPPVLDQPPERDYMKPVAVTQSHDRHRLPSPISTMSDPIATVLSSMRVQRMSLVQSLRQYLFVHRAIIAHYLALVDSERPRHMPSEEERSSIGSTTTVNTVGNTSTMNNSMDDEAHIKRKPSSSDLTPETDLRLQSSKLDELRLGDGAANLSKRLSFKKRKAERGESK